jgi:hypothetical protein
MLCDLLHPGANVAVAGRLHADHLVIAQAEQIDEAEEIAALTAKVVPVFNDEAGIATFPH